MAIHSFGLIIGKCALVPKSPAMALAIVAWFYGIVPGLPYYKYTDAIVSLAQREGETPAQARSLVRYLEGCAATWRTERN